MPEGLASSGYVLVTGNPGKIVEARRLCGFELQTVEVDLPEIQSLDLVEVVRAKAAEAWRRVERPLVVEEVSLELAAFGGFPGPLIKWMLQAMGPEGIASAVQRLGNNRATARALLLMTDGEHEIMAEGSTSGELVLPPRGEGGFGWDPVFQPEGQTLTYGELPSAEKDRLSHRGRAWRDLLSRLESS